MSAAQPMAATGRVCTDCGRDDRPHKGQGRCSACWWRRWRATRKAAAAVSKPGHDWRCGCWGCAERRVEAQQTTVARDWRGVPFAAVTIPVAVFGGQE